MWLWLEAVWAIAGHEPWELEEAGVHPASQHELLLARLCAELQQEHTRKADLLLVVDNADVTDASVERLLGTLLESTTMRVLLTGLLPWQRDVRGYKVMDVPLQRLDGLSSAKLFLRRVRRPLHQGDFDEGLHQRSGCAFPSKEDAKDAATPDEFHSHVAALLQHPLLQFLDGHPGKIRSAAEQVTTGLSSLYDLHRRLAGTAGQHAARSPPRDKPGPPKVRCAKGSKHRELVARR